MVSSKAVRQALYQKLNVAPITGSLAQGSASLIHSVAPSNATYPLVIFNEQSGTPTHQFGGDHFDSQLWLVKAIAKGNSSSTAEDVSKAIADALDFQNLSITGADHMYMAREGDVTYAEVVNGEVYRHHGFYVRITFQDT